MDRIASVETRDRPKPRRFVVFVGIFPIGDIPEISLFQSLCTLIQLGVKQSGERGVCRVKIVELCGQRVARAHMQMQVARTKYEAQEIQMR